MRLRAPMIVAAYCMMIFAGAMPFVPEQALIEQPATASTSNRSSAASAQSTRTAVVVASPEFEHAMRLGD